MRSRLAPVLLCLLSACTVKCNCNTGGKDLRADAEKLVRSYAENVDDVDDVTCPKIEDKVGTRVECLVTFKDGTRHTTDVELTDENGGTLEGKWRRPVLGAKVRAELAERASQLAGLPMTLHCGDDKVIDLEWDQVTHCQLDTEKGSAPVLVYVNRESGWTFRPAAPTGGIQALTDAMMTQATQKAAAMLAGRVGPIASSECPKLENVVPGTKVECVVHFADGSERRAVGDIYIDSDGDLSARMDWAQPAAEAAPNGK